MYFSLVFPKTKHSRLDMVHSSIASHSNLHYRSVKIDVPPSMSSSNNETALSKQIWAENQKRYQAAKSSGEIKDGEWVVVANQQIIHRSTQKQAALEALYNTSFEHCYFCQVGTFSILIYEPLASINLV